MVSQIISAKPEQGADVSFILLENGNNVGYRVAQKLHAIADRRARAEGHERMVFRPNLAYELKEGLHFRLYDNGIDGNIPSVEFLALPGEGKEKTDILAQITEVMQQVGIEDKALLGNVRAAVVGGRGRA